MFKLDGEESDVLKEKVCFQIVDLESVSHLEGEIVSEDCASILVSRVFIYGLRYFWEVSRSNGIGLSLPTLYFTSSHLVPLVGKIILSLLPFSRKTRNIFPVKIS